MPAPGQAIPAMSTRDVSLAYYEIAARKTFHVIANSINDANKLVADCHWHWDRFLRPGVPIVDVHVGSTDGCFQDADEHIVAANFWNGNFLEPKARLRFCLHNGLHHFLHNGKLGQSGKQQKSFATGAKSYTQAWFSSAFPPLLPLLNGRGLLCPALAGQRHAAMSRDCNM
jgi:hypothetical protein